MRLLGFRPEDSEGAGDAMPFFHEGVWHVFFLKTPKGAWGVTERQRNTLAHIVSSDLVNWEILPDAICKGPPGSVDGDGIWTGSVIAHEGRFHFYYTGNRIADGNSFQRICHATSDDLISWTKNPGNPVLGPDGERYETVDWRDPYVFRDDKEDCFRMLIATREKTGPVHRRGCIAEMRSRDLESWNWVESNWTRRITHCPECPETFYLGDYAYLVFSRYSERAQTIYRVARSLEGPWESRAHEAIDGRRFYAAKSASDGNRRVTFAWAHDKTRHDLDAPWEWGGMFASPRELIALPDGTLVTRLVPEVAAAYDKKVDHAFEAEWGDWEGTGGSCIRGSAPGSYGFGALRVERQELMLETEIELRGATHSAGILVEATPDMEHGYFIEIDRNRGTAALCRWPVARDPIWQQMSGNKQEPDLDTPLVQHRIPVLPEHGRIPVRLLRCGEMLECFVAEQVAITYRIYEKTERMLGLYVQEGEATFHNLSIRSPGS